MGQSFKLNDEPEKLVKNQIELSHDNDFLQFTDRYYTAGNPKFNLKEQQNEIHKNQYKNSLCSLCFMLRAFYTKSRIRNTY